MNLKQLLKKRRHIRKLNKNFHWRFGSRPETFTINAGYTTNDSKIGRNDVDRLIKSYNLRRNEMPTDQWEGIFNSFHTEIHTALVNQDVAYISAVLDNPVTSDLFYGFDALSKSLRVGGLRLEEKKNPALTFDGFLRLAEAMGVRRQDNPERYSKHFEKLHIDDVIDQIERFIGFELVFPNPYPNEYGLITKRGIATERVPQAIYQAWILSKNATRVAEIGGGLGRTSFYAKMFGIKDYTIVDIPITSLSQGSFLSKTSVQTVLEGEPYVSDAVKLVSPEIFFKSDEKYDTILNVDSLTEIGNEPSSEYVQKIAKSTSRFISINHESNSDSVLELVTNAGLLTNRTRHPSWIRRGYVEEVYEFNS
mgnify:CR=1 FL=1